MFVFDVVLCFFGFIGCDGRTDGKGFRLNESDHANEECHRSWKVDIFSELFLSRKTPGSAGVTPRVLLIQKSSMG